MQEPYQIYYEHTFTNVSHHDVGSNTYTFDYPKHWLEFPSTQRGLAIRSITINAAARDIGFTNIYLRNTSNTLSLSIDTNISLSYGEDMGVFNERMKNAKMMLYREYKDELGDSKPLFMPRDYDIMYNFAKNELTFTVRYMKNDTMYLYFDDGEYYTTDDFKQIVGIPDDMLFINLHRLQSTEMTHEDFNTFMKTLPNVSVTFAEGDNDIKVKAITFKNVWCRGSLLIASSLSTLSENKFLAISNTILTPPKYYDINGYKTSFTISLYDTAKMNPVELPSDARDLMIIECIAVAK